MKIITFFQLMTNLFIQHFLLSYSFRYYLSHNIALVKLLKKLGSRPIPQWLKSDLSNKS